MASCSWQVGCRRLCQLGHRGLPWRAGEAAAMHFTARLTASPPTITKSTYTVACTVAQAVHVAGLAGPLLPEHQHHCLPRHIRHDAVRSPDCAQQQHIQHLFRRVRRCLQRCCTAQMPAAGCDSIMTAAGATWCRLHSRAATIAHVRLTTPAHRCGSSYSTGLTAP